MSLLWELLLECGVNKRFSFVIMLTGNGNKRVCKQMFVCGFNGTYLG